MRGAVDGVAALGDEDRVRHRRVVPFARVMIFHHAEWLEVAGRRVVAVAAGRYRPGVAVLAVDGDRHFLRRLVDDDHNIGVSSLSQCERCDDCRQGERETVETHTKIPASTPITAA